MSGGVTMALQRHAAAFVSAAVIPLPQRDDCRRHVAVGDSTEGRRRVEALNGLSRWRPDQRARPLGAVAQRGQSGGVASGNP